MSANEDERRDAPSPGTTARRLYDELIAGDREAEAAYHEAHADAEVARVIYDARTAADLSQRELAARVGTTASVISRLEDAAYRGHSLAMLRRIAAALGLRLQVSFLTPNSDAEPVRTANGAPRAGRTRSRTSSAEASARR